MDYTYVSLHKPTFFVKVLFAILHGVLLNAKLLHVSLHRTTFFVKVLFAILHGVLLNAKLLHVNLHRNTFSVKVVFAILHGVVLDVKGIYEGLHEVQIKPFVVLLIPLYQIILNCLINTRHHHILSIASIISFHLPEKDWKTPVPPHRLQFSHLPVPANTRPLP